MTSGDQHAHTLYAHSNPARTSFTQPVGTPLLELLHARVRPTTRRVLPLEYYSLPPETKAELLATLCDDLLEAPTVQAEFERRELRGEFVTGEGGEGGAFAIRTSPEPKEVGWTYMCEPPGITVQSRVVVRATSDATRYSQGEEAAPVTDDNTDVCLVCGVGGNLLCCDGCPASFHMRCVAETNKTVTTKDDYLCPECDFGGRGEFAGLRVPPVGATAEGGLVHVVQHGLFTSTTCGTHGRGRKAIEYGPVATTLVTGDEAVRERVRALRPVCAAEVVGLVLRCAATDQGRRRGPCALGARVSQGTPSRARRRHPQASAARSGAQGHAAYVHRAPGACTPPTHSACRAPRLPQPLPARVAQLCKRPKAPAGRDQAQEKAPGRPSPPLAAVALCVAPVDGQGNHQGHHSLWQVPKLPQPAAEKALPVPHQQQGRGG